MLAKVRTVAVLTKNALFIAVSVSRKLANMFEQELRLKERLVAMVLREATVDSRDKLMACLAMWLHQPYLDWNYQQELELMLLETGLRTA